MTFRRPIFAVSVVLLGTFAAVVAQPGSAPQPAEKPLSTANQSVLNDSLVALTADEKRYFQMVTTLSDPFFEGRAPGLRGNQLVAEYVEFAFRNLNLAPAFPLVERSAEGSEVVTPGGSFRQTFPAGSDMRATVQEARMLVAGGPYGATKPGPALAPGRDFNVLAVSGSGAAEGPVVFAGYAIENGPNDFTSFKEGDTLEGRIALVFRFEPLRADGRSRLTESGAWSQSSSLNAKLRNVAKRKPLAVILVNPPGVADPRADRIEDVRSLRGGAAQEFPVVMFSREQAEALARSSGTTLEALRAAADAGGGVRELATSFVALKAETKRVPVEADNVGAVLAGRGDLASEFVVVGAHMDHVGYGLFGSRAGSRGSGKLHPGADDNASGTAGLILAAEKLAAAYAALPAGAQARSVLFVGFNAEESGLVGSRYFVRRSPVPASKTYAMLNMDMIGRVRNGRIDVYGVGTAEGFEQIVTPLFSASGLTVRYKNSEGALFGGSGPSDHASFYGAGVPVLHLFTGMSAEYHMPEDYYWTVNPVGAVRAVDMLVNIATTLALRGEPLAFKSSRGPSVMFDDPSASPAPTPQAPGQARPGATPPALPAPGAAHGQGGPAPAAGPMEGEEARPRPVRVRFGIAPGDYSDDKPGVLVGEVFPDTPAARAGIKSGDRIVKWNAVSVNTVEAWTEQLRAAKPGDVVKLTIVRDKAELVLEATLTGREPTPTP